MSYEHALTRTRSVGVMYASRSYTPLPPPDLAMCSSVCPTASLCTARFVRADIVRPNVTPPEMAKHVVKSDGVSTLPSASGLDGVIDVN